VKAGIIALLQLLPVLLSTLLIAAHFLRYGNPVLAILCLAAPLLLLVRHPLAARLVQTALFLAALEWIRTTAALAAQRSDLGLPWGRMTAILGAVAAFTLGSLFVFLSKTLRTRYNLTRTTDSS
jgi:hypothetical protein